MADYLAREDAPLSSEDWEKLDKLVVESARKRLVGRRFISIYGPLGAGAFVVQRPMLSSPGEGEMAVRKKENLSIPLIYKDFRLHWRDIEAAKKCDMPLELGPAAAAAAFCALKEDELIFRGDDEYGYKGLLNAEGRTPVEAQGWDEVGKMFQNVVSATEKLMSAGFYGPYAMAVSPSIYAMMHRVYVGGSGVLVVNMIRELVTDGVFQSPVLKEEEAVVLATGRENLDLVIGQDLVTAYLGPDGMDHPFRVLETAVLRIKRPAAICEFSAQ